MDETRIYILCLLTILVVMWFWINTVNKRVDIVRDLVYRSGSNLFVIRNELKYLHQRLDKRHPLDED